jgi:HEAT repeat protein
MVKKSVASILAASVLTLIAAGAGKAQTLVPKEKIPSDATPRAKELIELLYSNNPAVVGRAAARLGGLEGDAASIPFVIGILYDATPLEIVSGPAANLCSPNPQIPCAIRGTPTTVSQMAAKALARMGPPAFSPLLAAFTTGQPNRHYGKDRTVQESAAYALGLLKDNRAVEPLLRAFTDPSMADVRGRVAVTLGELGDVRAVEPLLAALKDNTVRSQAIEGLGNLRDRRALEPLLEILETSGIESRWLAAEAVVKMGKPRPIEEAVTLAIGQIGVEDSDQSVIPLLALKLGNRYGAGTYAETYLEKLASWELEDIKDQAAVDALIAAVKTDTKAAVIATHILGGAKVQRALTAIADAVVYGNVDYPVYTHYSNLGTDALKRINRDAAIEYMIGLAAEKKCGAVAGCDRIYSALRRITGQYLPVDCSLAWQRWWNRNKPRTRQIARPR